jgi:hypothetical protein
MDLGAAGKPTRVPRPEGAGKAGEARVHELSEGSQPDRGGDESGSEERGGATVAAAVVFGLSMMWAREAARDQWAEEARNPAIEDTAQVTPALKSGRYPVGLVGRDSDYVAVSTDGGWSRPAAASAWTRTWESQLGGGWRLRSAGASRRCGSHMRRTA